MKKLVLVLAVAFSASLFSCGNKAENAAENAADSADVTVAVETEAIVDTLTNDTLATDTTVMVAVEEPAQ